MNHQPTLAGTIRPDLNTADKVAVKEASARAGNAIYPDPIQPDIILSLDIESLALGPRPVITEIALLGYSLVEDELLEPRHVNFYPVSPQQKLNREIHVDTICWLINQPEEIRSRLNYSTSNDYEDLIALLRHLVTTFNLLTQNGRVNYELVCARPQFDVVAVETLLKEVGIEVPWTYDTIIDVRTMLKRAGINHKNVSMPSGVTPHTGFGDARWQIEQYKAAIRG